MMIAAWPVVDRSRVVHAFRPGGSASAEAPFRTLRGHAWASAGIRVTPRAAGQLAGQLTLFSALNVEAARLARHGNRAAAERVARAAEELEAGPEFGHLRRLLSLLTEHEAAGVLRGVVQDAESSELAEALKAVARRTEERRAEELILASLVEVIAGRIAEVHDGYVLLVRVSGPAA